MEKGAHYKVELWQPVLKNKEGRYVAILSDDSVDRDDEIVGIKALNKVMDDKGIIVGLMDHENKILNQVCQWENKRIEKIGSNNAFVAEPRFFKSNPNSQIIMGMLDEGAQMGISIGAIVKDYEEKKIGAKSFREYTDLDIVEASFVAVPANKHALCVAIAKSYKKHEEDIIMDKEQSEAFQKQIDESKILIEKSVKELDLVKKEYEEFKKATEDKIALLEKAKVDAESTLAKSNESIKAKDVEIEKLKKEPMLKGDMMPGKKDTKDVCKDTELPIIKSKGGN